MYVGGLNEAVRDYGVGASKVAHDGKDVMDVVICVINNSEDGRNEKCINGVGRITSNEEAT